VPLIGVLAVQGNFREHAAMLRRLGADVVEVRKPEQLEGLDGLVVPGGESTAIGRLIRLYGLEEAIRGFQGPIFGTCAGMILLDRAHLGLIDVAVDRNAFGRQVASFEVLAELDGEAVLLRDGDVLVASFHPELTEDTRVHELFLGAVREAANVRA